MFNLKICGIIAGAAFILSFIISLITGNFMPMLLVKPAIFGVLFFIISCVVNILVKTFIPEVLENNDSDDESIILPGSRINITEGDSPPATGANRPAASPAVPVPGFMGAQADEAEEGLGDISSLMNKSSINNVSGERTQAGMDQNRQDDYNTKIGDLEEVGETKDNRAVPVAAAEADDMSNPVDILPDLDSMAGAFLPSVEGEEEDTPEYSVSAQSVKPSPLKKAPAWAGDFNAKDLAAGLRTVLSKDKEG